MNNLLQLKSYLENSGLHLKGEIVADQENPSHVFATVLITRTSDGKQDPTKFKLNEIRNYFLTQDISLNFILSDQTNSDLESGLRATLMLVFPSLRNVFCSITDGNAAVWIDPKGRLTDAELKEVEKHTRKFFSLVGIGHLAIQSTTDERTPTKTVILSNIRTIAPATLNTLLERLRSKEFVIPSDDWLKRQLDSLRKKGAIVVGPDGGISLSLNTLRMLGTRKNSKSPDITRMLALAREGR